MGRVVRNPGITSSGETVSGHHAPDCKRKTMSSLKISREATQAVLAAFIDSERTPAERAALFRAEISPRILCDEPLMRRAPVSAANTLGTLFASLCSHFALEMVGLRGPILDGVLTDFSDEMSSLNCEVKSRFSGLPTVGAFNSGATAASDTDVTVTLDQFVETGFSFTASEVVGTSRNLVKERGEAMAVAMGSYIFDALAALITEVNFGTSNQTIKGEAITGSDTLAAIGKAMTAAGVPGTYRFGWVSSAVAESLWSDDLLRLCWDQRRLPDYAYSHWSGFAGFRDIWEVPSLPANGINLTGFFSSRSSLVLAARCPIRVDELGIRYHGSVERVTDPVTGLSFILNTHINPSTWATTVRLIALFGVALGNAAVGHTLVSAA